MAERLVQTQVLTWLVEFRDTADDDDMKAQRAEIEDVSAKVLEALIDSTDILAVLFCESPARRSSTESAVCVCCR